MEDQVEVNLKLNNKKTIKSWMKAIGNNKPKMKIKSSRKNLQKEEVEKMMMINKNWNLTMITQIGWKTQNPNNLRNKIQEEEEEIDEYDEKFNEYDEDEDEQEGDEDEEN